MNNVSYFAWRIVQVALLLLGADNIIMFAGIVFVSECNLVILYIGFLP
jgi:hypothetical protein